MSVDAAGSQAESLKQVAEKNPNLVWIADPHGNLTYINERWVDWTGLPVEAGLKTGYVACLHQDDWPAAGQKWRHALASGTRFESEARVRMADGSFRWMLAIGVPVYGADNSLERWIGTTIDIHELKTSSEWQKRLESQHQLESIAETIPQIVWATDPQGKVDYANERWYQYSGITERDPDKWDWSAYLHPEEREYVINRLVSSLQSGENFEVHCRIRRHDGVYRWHLARGAPLRDRDGTIVRWFGTNTDIHDQTIERERQAEALENLIKQRTEELHSIADLLSEFVETGDFVGASEKLLQFAIRVTQSESGFIGAVLDDGTGSKVLRVFAADGFGWTADQVDLSLANQLVGEAVFSKRAAVFGGDHAALKSGIDGAVHARLNYLLSVPTFKGDDVVGVIIVANRDGNYSDKEIRSVELLGRTASVIYESYRRGLREQALIAERATVEDRLRRANESLLELAYVVSHELQEPLRVIKSDLSLLSVRYQDRLGTDADEFIRNAVNSAGTVNRMIDDLWEYARIERPHIKFETVDLRELFEKAVIAVKNEIAPNRQVSIHADPLPSLTCDRRQIGIVFRQLLLNAVTHNESAVAQVAVRVSQAQSHYEFCVEDNGIGFEPTESHEIFKMFRKLSKGSTGTGMGLAITKRIVEFHGGTIWAESTRTQGSRIYFRLPLSD